MLQELQIRDDLHNPCALILLLPHAAVHRGLQSRVQLVQVGLLIHVGIVRFFPLQLTSLTPLFLTCLPCAADDQQGPL